MTDTQIAALREIVGRMTPGEWQANGSHFYSPDPERMLVGQCLYPMGDKSNDIAGIVALRNTALPIIDALVAENARLREALHESIEDNCWNAYHIGIVKDGQWMDGGMSDAEWLRRELGLADGWHDAAAIQDAIPVFAANAVARVVRS